MKRLFLILSIVANGILSVALFRQRKRREDAEWARDLRERINKAGGMSI